MHRTDTGTASKLRDSASRARYIKRGFEIFRTYKRKEYRATAQDGNWLRLDTGDFYASLNQLNASITAGNENVWNGNWKFRGEDDTIKPISALRA